METPTSDAVALPPLGLVEPGDLLGGGLEHSPELRGLGSQHISDTSAVDTRIDSSSTRSNLRVSSTRAASPRSRTSATISRTASPRTSSVEPRSGRGGSRPDRPRTSRRVSNGWSGSDIGRSAYRPPTAALEASRRRQGERQAAGRPGPRHASRAGRPAWPGNARAAGRPGTAPRLESRAACVAGELQQPDALVDAPRLESRAACVAGERQDSPPREEPAPQRHSPGGGSQ